MHRFDDDTVDPIVPAGRLIALQLQQWGSPPFVLREVFGELSATAIAAVFDAFCVNSLGRHVAGAVFFKASVGAALGAVLDDGSRIVVKVHRPSRSAAFLQAVQTVQRVLAQDGFPSPTPLVGPVPFGNGIATIETLLEQGRPPEARQPAVRRAMASGLAQFVARCRALVTVDGLAKSAMRIAPGELWPTPHDGRFDFPGTIRGAEWIDELARRVRPIVADARSGGLVVGHTDWRAENMRLDGLRISAVYDWDSLALEVEPVLVGGASHLFTANWSSPTERQLPTLAEALAFIADYEQARGMPFTPSERTVAGAALVYSMAYTARCEHSDAMTGYGEHSPDPERAARAPPGEAAMFLAELSTDLP